MTFHAVLFDVGGVLLRTEDPGPRRALERRFGLPAGAFEQLVFNSPISQAASVGQATSQQVWEHVRQQLGLSPASLEQVQREFWAGDRWNKTLIRFAKSLRPSYQTAVLSNAWPDARESFAPLLASEAFQTILISAEEGLMKPDPRFFQLALGRLCTPAEETVLVDDLPVNLQSARGLGMGAVQFTNTGEVVDQIRQMLRS